MNYRLWIMNVEGITNYESGMNIRWFQNSDLFFFILNSTFIILNDKPEHLFNIHNSPFMIHNLSTFPNSQFIIHNSNQRWSSPPSTSLLQQQANRWYSSRPDVCNCRLSCTSERRLTSKQAQTEESNHLMRQRLEGLLRVFRSQKRWRLKKEWTR